MNQTRTFLFFAMLAVAYLLWTAWEKDYAPPPATVAGATSDGSVPTGAPGASTAAIPSSGGSEGPAQLITVGNDLLRLTIDTRGGSVVRSELLRYPDRPSTKQDLHPPATLLLDDAKSSYFAAQDGLVSSHSPAPDHRALFQAAQTSYQLADNQKEVKVDLTWQDPSGVKVTKTYTLTRGSYLVGLTQKIDNGSSAPWQGNAYEQLQRTASTVQKTWLQNFTDPSSHSFFGAAWYSPEDKFSDLPFAEFQKRPLERSITGGWASMLQHYFFVAWIPPASEANTYTTSVVNPDTAQPNYLIRTVGPTLTVAPGQSATSQSSLYIGPKLQGQLDAIAPGLELTTNYGWFTVVAQPLHGVLSMLESLCGNWGMAIILLVLVLKAVMWKLSASQFRSAARMRKLQPRVTALRERYGDDKLKMQQAMMELYKKEKVNPMAGCAPILVTMPVFIGLYRVLMESVELRHAPFLWIHDLSAADPLYILPVIYVLVMLATQWLNPAAAGMDPAQARMMKVMPLLFGAMFFFFPSGLVLYWVISTGTGLLQQWMITRSVEKGEGKPKAA